MRDSVIIEQIERLGALFPWESVQLEISRKPGGEVSFQAWLLGNEKVGLEIEIIGSGVSLAAVCANADKKASRRNPERMRQERIAKLEAELAALRALDMTYPPYRPGTRLAAGALRRDIEAEATVTEESGVSF